MVDITFENRAEVLHGLNSMSSDELAQVYSVFFFDTMVMKKLAVHPKLETQKIVSLATNGGKRIRSEAFRNPVLQKQTHLWRKIVDNNITHTDLIMNLLSFENLPAEALLYAHSLVHDSVGDPNDQSTRTMQWQEPIRRKICGHPNFPLSYINERLQLIHSNRVPDISKKNLAPDILRRMRRQQKLEASYFLAHPNLTSRNIHGIVVKNMESMPLTNSAERMVELCSTNPNTEDRTWYFFIDQQRGSLLIDLDVDMSVEILEYLLLWFQTTPNHAERYPYNKQKINYVQETLFRLHQTHPDYKDFPIEWVEAIYEV